MPKYLISYRKTEENGSEAGVGRLTCENDSPWRATPSGARPPAHERASGEKLWGDGEAVWIGSAPSMTALQARGSYRRTSIVYGQVEG